MKVLVTGAGGYVGGRLAHALLGQHEVCALTRSAAALGPLLDGAQFIDAGVESAMDAAVEGAQAVVHLAAANEVQCGQDPVAATRINVLDTARLLQAAIDAGVKRFVYFSTAHVYASPLAGTLDESCLPRPAHPYASTHLAAEDLIMAEHRRGKIAATVLRLSNGVGAPLGPHVDRWTLLVNDLCRQFVRGEPLTLRSDGTALRDFIPLADVCGAVLHLLSSDDDDALGVLNLSAGQSLSIWDLTQRIADNAQQLYGRRPQIRRPEPNPDATSPALTLSNARLAAAGFTPALDLDAAIRETFTFCTDHEETPRD